MDGPKTNSIDQLAINTIRTLSMDAVQAANSGHPGTPMALAPVAYTLWQRVLKFNPDDISWPNRDRFVLSAGHASMLLYSLLHLTGVKAGNGEPAVTLDDIRHFRQVGSHCPGHPEYRHTAGVETTTGPLGQGCGNSVGMAIATRYLANRFNRPEFAVFDYDVYALCSDGDMMEGVSSEAASIAGHLALGNLCWIYDNNHISIEGHTSLAFTEDVGARFRAYGWNVEHLRDANDCDALFAALGRFRQNRKSPTLIIVDSHIAYGAPHKQDTAAAHGEPLGEPEVKLAKQFYGWPEDAKFLVPDGVREHFDAQFGARGRKLSADWYAGLKAYRERYPDLAQELDRMESGELPKDWDSNLPDFPADAKGMATREASGKVLNAIATHVPWLLGGSGDLAPSTKTLIANGGDFEPGNTGRNLHFGVREHGMGAVSNGLALSGLRPYCATFLIFSDYMRPPIRLAAMMELPVVYVFTHDSIGLGEDGPTHQPIEQLAGLRAIPGLITIRPADANEVREAWRFAMESKRPTALSLSRQALPVVDRKNCGPASGLQRGAYVLADVAKGAPDVILLASGSEVQLCMDARDRLAKDGIRARVVSMPSWELFEEQDPAYRNQVLPTATRARVSVEAASLFGWDRYVGADGARIGMTTFGASGPYKDVYRHFGITVEHVVEAAKEQVARNKGG
ncbi:MAG: transketolase [Alphaproteobacteria bacterium]|nr:transketolase [Alphaproteobacteria bacterium]